MMFCKNMREVFFSSDGDTDIFYIDAGVLQSDTLPHYIFIIRSGDASWLSIGQIKETDFALKSRKYHTLSDYIDDLVLLKKHLAHTNLCSIPRSKQQSRRTHLKESSSLIKNKKHLQQLVNKFQRLVI